MQFYIIYNDENHGPLDVEQLSEYGLTPESRVWSAGWASWKNAGDVPEIQEYLAGLEERRVQEEIARAAAQSQASFQPQHQTPGSVEVPPAYEATQHTAATQPTAPAAPITKWYLGINNVESGPYSESELLSAGMQYDSLVWTEGMSDWVQAQYIPLLKQIIDRASSAHVSTPPSYATPPSVISETVGDTSAATPNVGKPWVVPAISLAMAGTYFLLFIIIYVTVISHYYYFSLGTGFMGLIVPITATIMAVVKASSSRSKARNGQYDKAQRASGGATAAGFVAIISWFITIIYLFGWLL